jgi:hypothetical protein
MTLSVESLGPRSVEHGYHSHSRVVSDLLHGLYCLSSIDGVFYCKITQRGEKWKSEKQSADCKITG